MSDSRPKMWSRAFNGLVGLGTTARSALVGAALGALFVALWEGIAIASSSRQLVAALAAPAAACLLGVLAVIIASIVVWSARAVVAALGQLSISWAALAGAFAGSTFAVLGAQYLALKVLSGQGIRTATIALSAGLGALAGIAIAALLQMVMSRTPWCLQVRGRVAILLVTLIGTSLAAVVLSPGFVEELDVRGLAWAAIPLALALVCAVSGIATRSAFRAALGVAVLLGALALLHAALPRQPKAALAISRQTDAARFVFDGLQTLWPRKLTPIEPLGTCVAGGKPPLVPSKKKARSGAPDVLFITMDAVRWDHMTIAGYKRDTTPNIARWAKRAAVFSLAYSPSSSTRLSFRALFSGLYPSQIPPSKGSTWWGLTFPPDQLTLADHFAAAGYRTFAGADKPEGFDSKAGHALKGFNRLLPPNSAAKGTARARHQVASLIAELQAARSEPLFAWTHLVSAHQPYKTDTPSPYGKAEIDRYDWAIHFVDSLVGQVMDALEASGRLDNTYVVLSADHGQAFREHGNELHGRTVYQEETNVPLLIWGPGIEPGLRHDPVAVIDVFPTVLELAQLPSGSGVCGASLAPWLRDAKIGAGRDVYVEKIPDERKEFAIAYIKGWHKLVVAPYECSIEVFDLRRDKRDRDDLSDKHPSIAQGLISSLLDFYRARGMNPKSYCLD